MNLGYDFICGSRKYVVYKMIGNKVIVPYLKLKESIKHKVTALLVGDKIVEIDNEAIIRCVYGESKLMITEGFKFEVLDVVLKTPPQWRLLKIPVPKEVYELFIKKLRSRKCFPDELIKNLLAY